MTDPVESGGHPRSAEPGRQTTSAEPGEHPTSAEPGERPPRRLERAPAERYLAPQPTQPPGPRPIGRTRATATLLLVMVAGAVLLGVLGSFNLDAGLLAVTAGIGWAVGLTLAWAAGRLALRAGAGTALGRGPRAVLGALLGAGASAGGLALLWAWARFEGGVLDPVAYADARFGMLAVAFVLVAAAAAAIRAGAR